MSQRACYFDSGLRRPRRGARYVNRFLFWMFITFVVGVLALVPFDRCLAKEGGPAAMGGKQPPQPVTATVVTSQSVPVWFTALGTVTSPSLVNVMPRVAGLLESVNYKQGQMVKAGQLLAQIDPRSFTIAVEQAKAQLEQTQAQLTGAQHDLSRYELLLKQDSISAQQVADQRATVAQLKANLDVNRAALDNARLQLSWTRITAPVSGLAGLRTVDAGNMVAATGAIGSGNSTNNGAGGNAVPIAVIAQVQPVDVTFALPQQQIGTVVSQLMGGKELETQAWDARNRSLLATGKLIAADNQINTATGTLNLRAEFGNTNLKLFPNQFVNIRVLVNTIPDAIVVPSTAVAVGAPGTYVYVIAANDKVALRTVKTGVTYNDLTQIVSGLQPGERVVSDGLDRLRDGRIVQVVQAAQVEGKGPISGDKSPVAPVGRKPGPRHKPATAAGTN